MFSILKIYLLFLKKNWIVFLLKTKNMGIKKTTYIENINIPKPLSLKTEPEFNICNLTNDGQTITLDYILDDNGLSIQMDDYQRFQELPSRIEIISGGWYGENGRWTPLTRYVGKIICENALEMKKISDSGKDFKFKVKKAFFSDSKILTIESEKVGKVKIKCKNIVPQEYEIFLFSKLENKWIPRKSFVI
jgi:hypothetical protein